jgi:bacteriochlorophyllide a dehydrogenase
MQTLAVVFDAPQALRLRDLPLVQMSAEDVVVDIAWSGISTGTERLLYSGTMPAFPGLGYPLVPGYEAVGTVTMAGAASGRQEGDRVFVPGARCYGDVKGLFGGAARHVIVPGARVHNVAGLPEAEASLLALAATAYHAVKAPHAALPELIVGHGVVGRLIARITLALGGAAPIVWETRAERMSGGTGYKVLHPEQDARRDYNAVMDASGDAGILNALIGRLAKGGEIALAGFYHAPLSFAFPPAFMREARLRIAAEWQPEDMNGVTALIAEGRLSLSGLISHQAAAGDAPRAYEQAFNDPDCLKMVLDWRGTA